MPKFILKDRDKADRQPYELKKSIQYRVKTNRHQVLHPSFEQKRADMPPTSFILETRTGTERHSFVGITFEQVEQKGRY